MAERREGVISGGVEAKALKLCQESFAASPSTNDLLFEHEASFVQHFIANHVDGNPDLIGRRRGERMGKQSLNQDSASWIPTVVPGSTPH